MNLLLSDYQETVFKRIYNNKVNHIKQVPTLSAASLIRRKYIRVLKSGDIRTTKLGDTAYNLTIEKSYLSWRKALFLTHELKGHE